MWRHSNDLFARVEKNYRRWTSVATGPDKDQKVDLMKKIVLYVLLLSAPFAVHASSIN